MRVSRSNGRSVDRLFLSLFGAQVEPRISRREKRARIAPGKRANVSCAGSLNINPALLYASIYTLIRQFKSIRDDKVEATARSSDSMRYHTRVLHTRPARTRGSHGASSSIGDSLTNDNPNAVTRKPRSNLPFLFRPMRRIFTTPGPLSLFRTNRVFNALKLERYREVDAYYRFCLSTRKMAADASYSQARCLININSGAHRLPVGKKEH